MLSNSAILESMVSLCVSILFISFKFVLQKSGSDLNIHVKIEVLPHSAFHSEKSV